MGGMPPYCWDPSENCQCCRKLSKLSTGGFKMLLSGNNIGLSEKYPPPPYCWDPSEDCHCCRKMSKLSTGGGGIYLKCCPENFLVCRKIFTVCRKSNAHVPPPQKKTRVPQRHCRAGTLYCQNNVKTITRDEIFSVSTQGKFIPLTGESC